MLTATLYTRPGCHLCEEMKAVVERVSRTHDLRLLEVDISTDPELERLYGVDIPVLLIEGKEAARHRVSEAELLRILAGGRS